MIAFRLFGFPGPRNIIYIKLSVNVTSVVSVSCACQSYRLAKGLGVINNRCALYLIKIDSQTVVWEREC